MRIDTDVVFDEIEDLSEEALAELSDGRGDDEEDDDE